MAGENKTSVLQSATPRMNQQGQQDSYNGKNGLVYKFNLVFANGDSGEGSAKSTTKVFPIGKNCTYTKYTREYKGSTFMSFTSVKDADAPAYTPGGGGSAPRSSGGYKKTPDQQKIIINQVALIGYNSCMLSLVGEDEKGNPVMVNGNDAYLAFREWMYNKIFNLNEDPMTLQGVFKIACENVGTKADNVTLETVLKKAEGLLGAVKNISWNNPAAAPQQSNLQPTEHQTQAPTQQPTAPPVETPPAESQPPPKEAFEI